MPNSDERSKAEARLKELEQEREAKKEAYLRAPMDLQIAKEHIDGIFANKREIDAVKRQLESE